MQHEELVKALQIPNEAEIIINSMKFLLRTDNERLEMYLACSARPGLEFSYLGEKRRNLIDEYGYNNKEEFVSDCLKDKISALERLCQEKVSDCTLGRFRTNDPEIIFDAYTRSGKYLSLSKLALLT